MTESPHNHSQQNKIEFLHQENQQLRNTIEDLQMVIKLNKQSMRNMIAQDTQCKASTNQTTLRDNENTVKALKLVITEQQREIDYLMQSLDKVQKERDFAQGKALISEEITVAAEKSEKLLIAQLETNIRDLNQTIQRQAQKIQEYEKSQDTREDHSGAIIKYRDIIHPNTATILLHEEMEVLHSLTVKLQLQISYSKSIQVKLVQLLHSLLSQIQVKLQEEMIDLDEVHEDAQQEFLSILELIQNSKFLSFDQVTQQANVRSPLNTEQIGSPILSPFPNKAPQLPKFQNLNQTFDGNFDQEKKNPVPKLNLNKALQIQQINAKRSTQQVKMTEDQVNQKMKKLELDVEEAKKSVQREMLLARHFEIENDQMRRYIKQLEANNDTLVKSNMNFQQKWTKIQQSFMFYKTFFVEHKDQFTQLQQLVQSEKEKITFHEEIDLFNNFNSARLHNKSNTIRKRNLDTSCVQPVKQRLNQNYNMNDLSSLIEVEKQLGRQNVSYSHHNNRLQSESIVNESAADYDLGNACMERPDSADSPTSDQKWKQQCKREWSIMATQVHQQKQNAAIQEIRQTIPIQKMHIKL